MPEHSLSDLLLQSLPVPQVRRGDVPHVVLQDLKNTGVGQIGQGTLLRVLQIALQVDLSTVLYNSASAKPVSSSYKQSSNGGSRDSSAGCVLFCFYCSLHPSSIYTFLTACEKPKDEEKPQTPFALLQYQQPRVFQPHTT